MTLANSDLTAYTELESVSARLHERARRVMPGGNTRTTVYRNPCPPYAANGRGQVIVDVEGQTRAHGILLICAEVITLRVSPGGVRARYGLTPDLTTMGKVIGGGIPVGAVGGRTDVMAVFDPSAGKPKVPHRGTFTANDVAPRSGSVARRRPRRAADTRLTLSPT